jgi:hypothetical protein
MGPHSTSASALKHSAPRLAGAISRAFLHEQQDTILGTLRAYDEIELRLGADPFDQTLRKPG